MAEERLRPIELMGTGLAYVADHEKTCAYATAVLKKLSEGGAQTDFTPEDLCTFSRSGRCVLADLAIKDHYGVELPSPPIRLPDLKGRTE